MATYIALFATSFATSFATVWSNYNTGAAAFPTEPEEQKWRLMAVTSSGNLEVSFRLSLLQPHEPATPGR